MNVIECPALRNDDTLGFLAALGLLELTTQVLDMPNVRLGWTGVGGHAVLADAAVDRSGLIDALHGLAERTLTAGRVVPVDSPDLIRAPVSDDERRRRAEGLGVKQIPLDPLKMVWSDAAAWLAQVSADAADGDSGPVRWALALVNQLAGVDDANLGRVQALTPLYSPSGRMTLYSLFRDATTAAAGSATMLDEALGGWARHVGAGGNLDQRALVTGADTSSGTAGPMHVPGATWLALMSIPFFRQAGDGGTGRAAVSWTLPRRGSTQLRWPVWAEPLDHTSVGVLLSHPAVSGWLARPNASQGRDAERRWSQAGQALRAIGVDAVCTTSRLAMDKSAGALLPPKVVAVP